MNFPSNLLIIVMLQIITIFCHSHVNDTAAKHSVITAQRSRDGIEPNDRNLNSKCLIEFYDVFG